MALLKSKKSRAANEQPTPIYLTPEGIERLYEKHSRLKKALPDLAAEAARTAAYGDRSDNAEYKQAKGALRYTHREIYRLEDEMKRAVAIPVGRNAEGTVRLGSVVVVREEGASGEAQKAEKTFAILGPHETDPGRGRISDQSPLGLALIGHAKGDIVTIETEHGPRKYIIVEVR